MSKEYNVTKHYLRDDDNGNVAYWWYDGESYRFHSHSDDGMARNTSYASYEIMEDNEPLLWNYNRD